MKRKFLKITEKDWDAINAFVEIGIQDTIGEECGQISAYRKDFEQWKKCQKRIDKQRLKDG